MVNLDFRHRCYAQTASPSNQATIDDDLSLLKAMRFTAAALCSCDEARVSRAVMDFIALNLDCVAFAESTC